MSRRSPETLTAAAPSAVRRFSYATGFSEEGPPPPDDEFVRAVTALDAEQAAEEAAEDSDRWHCDYPDEQAIFVKDMQTGEVSCFSVHAEAVRYYRAVRVHLDALEGTA